MSLKTELYITLIFLVISCLSIIIEWLDYDSGDSGLIILSLIFINGFSILKRVDEFKLLNKIKWIFFIAILFYVINLIYFLNHIFQDGFSKDSRQLFNEILRLFFSVVLFIIIPILIGKLNKKHLRSD